MDAEDVLLAGPQVLVHPAGSQVQRGDHRLPAGQPGSVEQGTRIGVEDT